MHTDTETMPPAVAALPALECRGLRKSYGHGRVVLAHLDFALAAGEYVAIMGDSGVGKSTLLNLIAGLDSANSGTILIDGVSMSSLDDDAATLLRRQKLGFIFQAFHVLPHLTLQQNVALPLLLNGAPQERALELLAAVGLAGRSNDFPRQLSGGEMQRVAIARALVNRPALILADEPTGNLDSRTGGDVMNLFAELHRNGQTLVVVTHDADIASHAMRRVVFHDGGIVADEPTERAREMMASGAPESGAAERRVAP